MLTASFYHFSESTRLEAYLSVTERSSRPCLKMWEEGQDLYIFFDNSYQVDKVIEALKKYATDPIEEEA